MHIGIVGAGRIGGGIARQLGAAGHDVVLSFSRDPDRLEHLAGELGGSAVVGTPGEAVAHADVVVVSVPWSIVPDAIEQMGSVEGKVVIDTTNQFGTPAPPGGQTAAQFNAHRLKGCRYTKSFNTLTAGFQAEASTRTGDDRVVQWICGDDAGAKALVSALVEDAGFVPVDLGPTATCAVMEAPRRAGAVYGEEYRAADAAAVVEAVRTGRPLPRPPVYS
jgi:predicted dinucleotide-binding enzyme